MISGLHPWRHLLVLMAGCSIIGGIIGWFSYEGDPEV